MVPKKKRNKVTDSGRARQASMFIATSGEGSTEEQGHTKNDSIPRQSLRKSTSVTTVLTFKRKMPPLEYLQHW